MAKRPKRPASPHQKLARRLAGISPKAKLPAKGSAERRAYDSAMRAQQRAEAGGKLNPRTGKPLQARASRAVVEVREKMAHEAKALRKKTVTVRGLSVVTTINGGGTGSTRPRRRELGDVTMTRAQYRAMVQLDKDQDDELLAELIANVSGRIEDLMSAPNVHTLEISDISFSDID